LRRPDGGERQNSARLPKLRRVHRGVITDAATRRLNPILAKS
jgi:hypothetical protein